MTLLPSSTTFEADDYIAYLPDADFHPPFTVRYAKVTDGQWSEPETLTERPAADAGLSLVIDGRGSLHASFGEELVMESPDSPFRRAATIRYLRRASGQSSWTREAVSPSAPARLFAASLGVDCNGDVYVAYCRASEQSPRCSALGVARRSSDEWSWEVIDERCIDTGEMATLAVDRFDGLHVAYRGCDESLAYGYRAGNGGQANCSGVP